MLGRGKGKDDVGDTIKDAHVCVYVRVYRMGMKDEKRAYEEERWVLLSS